VSSPTGRQPSSAPELQNIPIRTELGKKLNETFTRERVLSQAPPLADVDYAALELLVLASMFQK
jgi:DNA polymerase I-like protein with 3'-5' exonuclease and polymerase domains